MLIKRVRVGTEWSIGEEQCGFRKGSGCMDQVFAVRQVCEKYLTNVKEVFFAFMDLEKPYDNDRSAFYVAGESIWSWIQIVGSNAEFLYR